MWQSLASRISSRSCASPSDHALLLVAHRVGPAQANLVAVEIEAALGLEDSSMWKERMPNWRACLSSVWPSSSLSRPGAGTARCLGVPSRGTGIRRAGGSS